MVELQVCARGTRPPASDTAQRASARRSRRDDERRLTAPAPCVAKAHATRPLAADVAELSGHLVCWQRLALRRGVLVEGVR